MEKPLAANCIYYLTKSHIISAGFMYLMYLFFQLKTHKNPDYLGKCSPIFSKFVSLSWPCSDNMRKNHEN